MVSLKNDLAPPTAVVAAMAEEMAPLRARCTDARAHGQVTLARLDGHRVAMLVTGDGARNARLGVAALLRATPVGRLLALGVAGALSPDLAPGALVVGQQVLAIAAGKGAGETLHADGALVDRVARALPARRGVVVTSDRIADTVAEKQRLAVEARAAVGDDALAAVVDLESAIYAAAAAAAGIPWLVVRAVSDTASEALPALLNRSRDDGGAVRRSSVVRGLLGDPGALPVLMSLRRRVRDGAEALARVAGPVLAAFDDAAASGADPRADAAGPSSTSTSAAGGL